jgi:hypothetical protein
MYFLAELRMFRDASTEIIFAGGDVAYDVCAPMKDLIIIPSDMRRKLNLYETTRYFGKSHQRKQDGYCRAYDKGLEVLEKQGIQLDHDLSHIEIVYKPQGMQLKELLNYPPKHNRQYTAMVLDDWTAFTAKERERLLGMQSGLDMHTRYIREEIKKTLADRTLNFDRLASAQWVKNQLHQQLSYHYPSYQKFFSELDGKCALDFWNKYPSPQKLNDTTAEKLAEVLRKVSNNACSQRKAEEILALALADGDTTRSYQEQRNFLIQSHVRDIEFKKKEIVFVEEELSGMMKLLDYKLETMPGIDTVTAAYLVAEIGDVKRFPNAEKLARFAGIAPVMFSSAGKGSNQKRRQGNRTLHGLFYNLAVQQVQVSKGNKLERNAVFNAYFKLKQAEGKTKGQALVCIMRRLVNINIIFGMMKNKTEYRNPEPVVKQAV